MVLMQTERQDLFPERCTVEVYSYRIIASGGPRSMQCFHPPPHPGRNFLDDFYAAYIFWLLKAFKTGDKYTNVIHKNRMSNITRALNSPIWPLGSFQPFSLPFALSVLFPGPAQLKDKFIPARCPKGPNEVSCQTPIMQLPGCRIWWPLVSCFTKSSPDKGPFDGLPFSNQSTPSPLGLQHLLLCNLILYSVQPDPIDKLNLSKPDILMPPRGKWLALILAFARHDMVWILTHFFVCLFGSLFQ